MILQQATTKDTGKPQRLERVIENHTSRVESATSTRVEEQVPPQGKDIKDISPTRVEQKVPPHREEIKDTTPLVRKEVDVGPRQHRYTKQYPHHLNLMAAFVTTAYSNTPVEGSIPMENTITDKKTGESMEYSQLIKKENYHLIGTRSLSKEPDRLSKVQGGKEEGTNTIFFILVDDVPGDRQHDVT